MFDSFDPRWGDDSRDRDADDWRDREFDRDSRDRGHDPPDVFLEDLELPRGLERELALERDRIYEINGEESRTLAAVGAFRVVAERDLPDPRDGSLDPRQSGLEHLRDEGLIRTVSLDGREHGVVLSDRGRELLEANRRDHHDERHQEFYAGVSRPRELTHDAQLYRAYLKAEERLRKQHADIQRVVLEQELKREYQCFLQEHNRDRPDSDGRPDRDAHEIEQWALDHDLPYFDDHVHFPDFRIEYEIEGRDSHEDIEVLTAHYRGAHAAARARTGFTCFRASSGGGGRGGRSPDPLSPRSSCDGAPNGERLPR